MRRRRFLTLVDGATAWPLVARAQTAIPVIGYISGRSTALEAYLQESFLKSLEESGFVVGRNIAIEYRHPSGRDDQMSELASELVRQQVTVLVATDWSSALAAKAATSTIPIVFASSDHPVRLGLVASFDRPGGNATGIYVFTRPRLGGKRLSLIRALLPKPGVIAFVVNPNNAGAALQVEEMQQAESRRFGVQRLVRGIRTVLIENLVLPYDNFVFRRIQSRVGGNNDGITSQRRSDRCVARRADQRSAIRLLADACVVVASGWTRAPGHA